MANPKGINQYSGLSPANAKLAKRRAKWDKEYKEKMAGTFVSKVPKPKRFRTAYGWAGGGSYDK